MTKRLRNVIFLICVFAVPGLSAGPALSQDEVIGPTPAEPPKEEGTAATQPSETPSLPPEEKTPVQATLSAEDKQALEESVKETAAQVARQAVSEAMAQQKAAEAQKAPSACEVKGNFMDTRVTWVFGDDDFLADAGEKIPDSPLMSIGDREGYELFMDNIDSRYTGRENLTHLVMYKKMPAFFPKLTTEAALVLKFQVSESDVDMTDDGTYIRIHYHTAGEQSEDGLSLVFFPFDTERFRLGYLWDISWGGGAIFTNKRNGWAPGLKLALKIKQFNMFLGFKTAKVSQLQAAGPEGQPLSIQQTNYGALGGVGYDIIDLIKIDLGGGYFQQGTFEFAGIQGKEVYSFGGSLRVAFHKGMEVGLPADFALYRNMPEAEEIIAAPETYRKDKWGIVVALEGTAVVQHLGDPDNYASTKLQPAFAASGQVKVKFGNTRLHLTAFLRTLEFILHNVPSFTPFMAIPSSVGVSPEFFVALGADHFFPRARLTPGVIAGVQLPASYTSGSSTIVVRSEELRDILVRGDGAQPIITGRISLRFDLSSMLSLIAFVQYVRDTNRTRLTRDELGTYRIYTAENELGAAIVLQARF